MAINIYPEEIIPVLHKAKDCVYDKAAGEGCVIHDPSDHKMNGWDIVIRTDREYGLAERLCPHGIGHPDPDSLRFIRNKVAELKGVLRGWDRYGEYGPYASDVHGCDGCCV